MTAGTRAASRDGFSRAAGADAGRRQGEVQRGVRAKQVARLATVAALWEPPWVNKGLAPFAMGTNRPQHSNDNGRSSLMWVLVVLAALALLDFCSTRFGIIRHAAS